MKKMYLKILTGPDKGSVYEVSGHRVRIGRDHDNDIIIPKDARCSRQHAYLRLGGTQNEVLNLGKNTIVVNGKKGKKFKLESGDVIQLGRTKIQFEQDNPVQDEAVCHDITQTPEAPEVTKTQDRLFAELNAHSNTTDVEGTKTSVTLIKKKDAQTKASRKKSKKPSQVVGRPLMGATRHRRPNQVSAGQSITARGIAPRSAMASRTHQGPPDKQARKKSTAQPELFKLAADRAAAARSSTSRASTSKSSAQSDWMPEPLTPPPATSKRAYIYIGAAALVGWFLFSGGEAKKQKTLRSPAEVEQSIEQTQEQIKQQKKLDYKKRSEQYKKAQAAFVQGRRAYQQGQYERAHISFVACLNLYPQHSLCTRYQNLARKKRSEIIQYYMIKGRRLKRKKQYRQCAAAFKQVMNMNKDTNSLVYKEAQVNHEACHQKVEDQY